MKLSEMVQNMSEESKRAEAERFDSQKAENLKKMQEFTQMLTDTPKAGDLRMEIEECGIEQEDEFDDYLEQSLMKEADSMGIF